MHPNALLENQSILHTMKKHALYLTAFLTLLTALPLCSQTFDEHFENKTLRLDYIFAGTNRSQEIYVDALGSFDGWAGRRHHLSELPLGGNGRITVSDAHTGDTLYLHSFSTLFQEWQVTEEAASSCKSFENSFLIPYPKQAVNICVTLRDTHGNTCASLTHLVEPKDILIRKLPANGVKTEYIHKGGNAEECIDVAILAEGYTLEEMPLFRADCEATVEAILNHEPFKSQAKRFNFIAVESPSKDSGVSEPGKGIWKSTAIDSHFNTFYSSRYLTTPHVKQMHNLLNGIPYEHIIVLANTDTYGGGGIYNSYTLTTAHHASFAPVVVHEFGHSFGGLADEYYYDDQYETLFPADTEPWEQNITTLVDFASKWKDMLSAGTPVPTPISYSKANKYERIGVYEGAGYQSKGIYRPVDECRMKLNAAPAFCPVCQRALLRLIEFYTNEK